MRNLFCSALLLATTLTALDLNDRITRLEEKMQDVRTQTVYGNYGASTASAYPSMNTWGIYGTIEGLYMKFTEGGTDYAWTDTVAGGSPYVGKLKYLDYDWRFAFRVTAGYQFDCPDWDLWAEYMRFATSQSNTTNLPAGGGLYSNVFNGGSISSLTKIRQSVAFNTADLNLGRNYFLRRNVSMHPFFGLRGAWINQHQNTKIDSVSSVFYQMKQKNDYGGLGLRTGSSVRWHLSQGWSLFGSLSAALMWGQFDNSLKQIQTSSGTTTTNIDLNTDTRRILPNMMADAGITWEHVFRRGRLGMTLGYEFDYWWRQNQTVHVDASTTYTYYRISEDLALQGVKLNLGYDF